MNFLSKLLFVGGHIKRGKVERKQLVFHMNEGNFHCLSSTLYLQFSNWTPCIVIEKLRINQFWWRRWIRVERGKNKFIVDLIWKQISQLRAIMTFKVGLVERYTVNGGRYVDTNGSVRRWYIVGISEVFRSLEAKRGSAASNKNGKPSHF